MLTILSVFMTIILTLFCIIILAGIDDLLLDKHFTKKIRNYFKENHEQ